MKGIYAPDGSHRVTIVDGVGGSSSLGPTSVSRLPSAANSNNATVVKASAGRVYHINGQNAAAGVRYLKLYNKATAPTVGTDIPFSFEFSSVSGLAMSTGISYGLVTGAADNDNTSVTAADILGLNIMYA
jgi:hypothetical protein